MRKKIDRIGERSVNKFGSVMTIIKYNNARDVLAKFENGNVVNTEYKHFKNGSVKNVYDRTVYSIGFIGEGAYKPTIDGVSTSQYATWKRMLERCYDYKLHNKYPTYIDCEVTDEWHNFQRFAKWYDENYYEINGEDMHLDKDILIKGNKIYSPTNCIFVPKIINDLFTNRKLHRGKYPIGVYYNKRDNKYRAQCNNENSKKVTIGYYDNYEEAFLAYKRYKESVIKYIADSYKNKIPNRLYDVMIEYEVEDND